jgi:hypothetical protein
MSCCGGIPILGDIEEAVRDVGRAFDDAVLQPIGGVLEDVVDGVGDVLEKVGDTIGSIMEDPKKLALVALSIMAPGAGTALGTALGLSGTAATLVGQVAINTAFNGGDVKAAILSAAIPVVGRELAGAASAAFVDAGMDKALAETAGKVVSGAGLAAAQGKDPLDALISGGLSAGTAAITRDIPGFSDLPQAAQRGINAAVAAELSGKDPSQALVNAAMSVGVNTAKTAFKNADFSFGQPDGGASTAPEGEATLGGLPTSQPTTDTAGGLPTQGGEAPADGGDESSGPGFQGPSGPPTEDTARRQAEEYAKYLDYLQNPTATPDYAPQQMQISQENLDSYNRNLQDIADNKGGFTSQWQQVGTDRIMISDDGSGIGMNENGETYPLSPELVQQMVSNKLLNTADSGYVAVTGGTGNLPGGSGPATTTPAPNTPAIPLGGLPVTTNPVTTKPATTTPATPTASNPFGVNWLDSTPQMLKAASGSDQPAKLAELKQLYSDITPEIQKIFEERGISAPSNEQFAMPQYSTGGDVFKSAKDAMEKMSPKFTKSDTTLAAAPVVQPESRMLKIRHLYDGIRGRGMAQGGLPTKYSEAAPQGHRPEFITGVTGYYAQGGGTGQSDDIPAMLHDGDYVIDADAVAAFGDGSSKAGAQVLSQFQSRIPFKDDGAAKGRPVAAKIADGEYVFPSAFVTALGRGDNKQGAKILDAMRANLRQHKRSAPTSKIPPKAKSPLDYLKTVKG